MRDYCPACGYTDSHDPNCPAPERHAPMQPAPQAYDPTILTEWAEGVMIEHFIPRHVVEGLAKTFSRELNGMLVPPPWLYVLMLKARTPAQLQTLREHTAQRQLAPEHIAREASRLSAAAWETHHTFKGYAPSCKYCGKSAQQCRAEGHPIECPARRQHVPDWL